MCEISVFSEAIVLLFHHFPLSCLCGETIHVVRMRFLVNLSGITSAENNSMSGRARVA